MVVVRAGAVRAGEGPGAERIAKAGRASACSVAVGDLESVRETDSVGVRGIPVPELEVLSRAHHGALHGEGVGDRSHGVEDLDPVSRDRC